MRFLSLSKRNLTLLGLILGSACAPNPTPAATQILPPASPTPVPAPQTTTFTTPDGATLEGTLYGSGGTVVVFSVMGNCKRGWEEMADLVAQNGLMALTYQWRDCGERGPISEAELFKNFVNDARGAINFVRAQGADEIILAGASLGGLASAKLAIESQASGLIVFASPLEVSRWDFKIEPEDLDTDIPKLFLTAENDAVVFSAATRKLYDLSAEPKEWQTYPGYEHGTDLFDEENGEEIQERILEFILSVASEKP
jgi:alpha-beta hydrolase superfamily lysophospholipase